VPHLHLSRVTSIVNIDFYNLPKETSEVEINTHQIEIPVTKSGDIDCFAFWFDLSLDDKLTLSSGPGGEMFHWGQAVYTFPKPKKVAVGDVVKLNVFQKETEFSFSLAD
jgi:hypothetical protein